MIYVPRKLEIAFMASKTTDLSPLFSSRKGCHTRYMLMEEADSVVQKRCPCLHANLILKCQVHPGRHP